MSTFHKSYGTEGPLGFPLSEKQARNLDTLLKALPKSKEFEYRKTVFLKAPTELNPGERSDVSWISTETPDRYDHVVFAKGMNDSQFALNPIVTLNHDYTCPPIGRSLWRKFVKDGDTRGIKAKTVYPPMPASWPAGECWEPVKVFAQIQAGFLNAESIGCSLKDTLYCFLLSRWIQVPVPFRCGLVHVPCPFLDQPLIDAFAGTRGNEAVP